VLSGLVARPRLVVDLSRLTFIDASGLEVLIDAAQWTREQGGAMAVACSRPTLTRLLHTLEFHRLVLVADTIEESVAALNPPDPNDRPA